MALWQYTFNVVPKNALRGVDGRLPAKIDAGPEGFLNCPEWDIGPFREKVVLLVEGYLPKETNWSNKISMWGKDDETCLSIVDYEDGHIELTARLDLRSLNASILKLLEHLSVLLDAVGVGENGTIFQLNRHDLAEELKSSRAFKFVADPQKFFEDLERERKNQK